MPNDAVDLGRGAKPLQACPFFLTLCRGQNPMGEISAQCAFGNLAIESVAIVVAVKGVLFRAENGMGLMGAQRGQSVDKTQIECDALRRL